MLSRLRHWSRRTAARLPSALPSACALCGCDAEQALCGSCRERHVVRGGARCPCCALGLAGKAPLCADCLRTAPAYDATFVATDYTPPLDQLVLALKFGARLELAPLLAEMLRENVPDPAAASLPTLLIPVPLGPQRLVERGFNQALEIARPLGAALGVPVARDLAWRTRDTGAQSLLHPDQRRSNVADAFSLRADAVEQVRGRHVGVVDDVMTTGETLHAMAAMLKRFGAARVTNFVFARTLPA